MSKSSSETTSRLRVVKAHHSYSMGTFQVSTLTGLTSKSPIAPPRRALLPRDPVADGAQDMPGSWCGITDLRGQLVPRGPPSRSLPLAANESASPPVPKHVEPHLAKLWMNLPSNTQREVSPCSSHAREMMKNLLKRTRPGEVACNPKVFVGSTPAGFVNPQMSLGDVNPVSQPPPYQPRLRKSLKDVCKKVQECAANIPSREPTPEPPKRRVQKVRVRREPTPEPPAPTSHAAPFSVEGEFGAKSIQEVFKKLLALAQRVEGRLDRLMTKMTSTAHGYTVNNVTDKTGQLQRRLSNARFYLQHRIDFWVSIVQEGLRLQRKLCSLLIDIAAKLLRFDVYLILPATRYVHRE